MATTLLKTADDYAKELGRIQTAYKNEYKGNATLQSGAAKEGQKVRAQAQAAGVDLSGFGTKNQYGADFTQYWDGGPAGAYDPTKPGQVLRKPISDAPQPENPMFTAPNTPVLDWNSALSQAGARLDPLLERALAGVDASRYQDQLDTGQIANNYGGSHSGLAADAQGKVFIAASGKKTDLKAGRDAQAADMAQTLVQNSQDRADRLHGQAFQEWLGTQNVDLSRDQFDWGKTVDTANQTGMFNGQPNMASKEFAYRQARDQIGDKQWQSQFDQDVKYRGLEFALNKQVQLGQLSVQQGQLALSRSNSNTDNKRQGDSASFQQKMDIWKATGKAPAGINGVAEGTDWNGGAASTKPVSYDQTPEWASEIAALNSDPQGQLDDYMAHPQEYISTYGDKGYQQLQTRAKALIKFNKSIK